MNPTQLYLNLMKKTLTFALWPEPPVPLENPYYPRGPVKAAVVAAGVKFFKKFGVSLVRDVPYSVEDKVQGKIWPSYADTMVGNSRLESLQACVELILKDQVDGDLIETGVWRGGCCIFMKAILTAYGDKTRKMWVADSFQGLPEPDQAYSADTGCQLHLYEVLAVSQERVKANFVKYGLLDDNVIFA